MKVLLINDYRGLFGGVENYINELMNLDTGIRFRLYGKVKEPSALKKFYNLETKREIRKEIDSFKPHIIHAFNIGRTVTPSFMGYAEKKEIPLILSFRDYHYICPKTLMKNNDGTIITKHDSAVECILKHAPKRNIVYDSLKYLKVHFHRKLMSGHISYYLTPSDHLTEWIERKFPGLSGETLPNPSLITPSANVRYDTEERKDILYAGRISVEKGIRTLIEAFSKVSDKFPLDNLLIAGKGPDENNLKNMVMTNGLKRVKFIGMKELNELSKYYAAVRFTVVPSEWIESFGNVVLESFAFKTPVIVSNVGCIEFNTRRSKGGVTFRMGSSLDLAEKMQLLLKDPDFCKELGEKGHAYARKMNFENHIHDLTGIYEQVLLNTHPRVKT